MMKSSKKNKPQRTHFSVCFVLILLGMLVSALALGSFRLYGLHLEQRLAGFNREIEKIGDTYALLEQKHAALLSPSRIYNFAKSNLNMVTASRVETIRLLSDSYVASSYSDTRIEVARTPGILSRIFSGTANAKD